MMMMQLKARLSDAFDRFLEGVADNRQVTFDDDGWRLKTDPAEPPDPAQSDRLAELHRWLDARNRTIRLADLLIEVENDLGFSVHFQQPGERVDPGEVCALLAAILAHGCNLGLYTMEKVAPDIAYRRLKNVSDWRLVEENQRAALAAIVHGISRLDAAGHWGDGTTSASDGQRFAMPQKVLQRTYSTRFNDFALEFYSFVADNYAPFYSRPVECTDRDAPFVLDGVLYHESDLNLEEHYTDTHGYTEINFAAFGMVGMRFCPRIRSLHRQRIYCADPARDHGVLEPVLQRGRRAVNFRLIAEQWDRIGQFYAAFPAGHATASAALQRLNRFQASNRFYAANRELGRALKTEFVLQYMSEPKLRAKVRRGLLKVEQLHALARAVYYGQRGRISAREVYMLWTVIGFWLDSGWCPLRLALDFDWLSLEPASCASGQPVWGAGGSGSLESDRGRATNRQGRRFSIDCSTHDGGRAFTKPVVGHSYRGQQVPATLGAAPQQDLGPAGNCDPAAKPAKQHPEQHRADESQPPAGPQASTGQVIDRDHHLLLPDASDEQCERGLRRTRIIDQEAQGYIQDPAVGRFPGNPTIRAITSKHREAVRILSKSVLDERNSLKNGGPMLDRGFGTRDHQPRKALRLLFLSRYPTRRQHQHRRGQNSLSHSAPPYLHPNTGNVPNPGSADLRQLERTNEESWS